MNVWKCKNGSEILISSMTDDHLINSIKYIRNKGLPCKKTARLFNALMLEYRKRELERDPNGPMGPAISMLTALMRMGPKNQRIDPDDAHDWQDDPGMGPFFEQE